MIGTASGMIETVVAMRTSVSIVEDDPRCREALALQLSTAGFEVASHPSAERFLDSAPKDWDCVIADIYLPGMNGVQLLRKMKELEMGSQLVFITGCGDISCGVQVMREGAVDCLEKPVDHERLIDAVTRAAQLSRKKRGENFRRVELQRRERYLTPREREVFALVTAGLRNKQIGNTLGATERTIKSHRGRVMEKMEANSLAELVRMADLLNVYRSDYLDKATKKRTLTRNFSGRLEQRIGAISRTLSRYWPTPLDALSSRV